MERVGFVFLSIIVATAILVGASYGALWLQPYAWHLTQNSWAVPLFGLVLPLAAVIAHYRRKRARPLA